MRELRFRGVEGEGRIVSFSFIFYLSRLRGKGRDVAKIDKRLRGDIKKVFVLGGAYSPLLRVPSHIDVMNTYNKARAQKKEK